jgi:hypothetical protein
VCDDAARLFWIVHAALSRSSDDEGLADLWAFARYGRLHDIALLDQLILLAGVSSWGSSATLESLARKHCCLHLPSHDEIERNIFEVARSGQPRQLGEELLADAMRITDAVLCIYDVLSATASRISQEHGIGAETTRRFGPLALGLQVQGAIALYEAAQTGLCLRHEAVAGAARSMEELQANQARVLWANHDARRCFLLRDGGIAYGQDGLPSCKPKQLAQWLGSRLETLLGEYGIPLPGPSAQDAPSSTVGEDWGLLRACDPLIAAWSGLVTTSRNLADLHCLLPNHPRLQPIYHVLPRIRSNDPSQDRLSALRGHGLFRPRAGQIFVACRLDDLELRALAATCLKRGGDSEIAELFRAGVDVYSHTVAGLGNHFDRWNARSNQDRIGIAKALLLAAPLQLGPAQARTIAESRFGVLANVTAAEIVGLYRALLSIYPELREYTRDRTHDLLASALNMPLDAWSDSSLAAATAANLRRALSGYRPRRVDENLMEEARRLNRNPGLTPYLSGRTGNAALCNRVFATTSVTVVGRVRGPEVPSEFNAPHLDLADDAAKAALFAVIANGFTLAAYANHEFVVEAPEDDRVSGRAAEIAQIAEGAITAVLQGVPGRCLCEITTHW